MAHSKFLTILVIVLLLASCLSREDKKKKIYYVIKHPKEGFVLLDSNKYQNDSLPPPLPAPPPLIVYGHHNFILYDTSKIFYYKADYDGLFLWCGTGIDKNHPPKLNLTSEKVAEIKISKIQQFLNTIIPDSIGDEREIVASISYPTDTIRHRAFEIITNHFKKKGIRLYNIRNWTEEESSVIKVRKMERK